MQTRSMTLKSQTFYRSYLDLKVCPWSVKPCYCNASWDRLPPTQCWAMSAGERYKHRTTEGLSRRFFAAALSVTISWTSTHLLCYWLFFPLQFSLFYLAPFTVNANISLECQDNSKCNRKNEIWITSAFFHDWNQIWFFVCAGFGIRSSAVEYSWRSRCKALYSELNTWLIFEWCFEFEIKWQEVEFTELQISRSFLNICIYWW